jgi:uncharacterized repeat protein (TIGR04138 family)
LWPRDPTIIFLSSAGPPGGPAVGARGYQAPHFDDPVATREAVAELAFREGIMDRIRLREPRFDERAYLFVLAALEYCQQRLDERRHINGRELALACRDLALERFGVMARLVLDHWGVRTSADIGDVVFTLVDLGLLMSQPTDTRDEFIDVFDFDQAFEREYPWGSALTV